MDLLRRKPGVAYYSNVLALPRSELSEEQLEGALTYELGGDKEQFRAYSIDREHFLVPRNYIRPRSLGVLPYPVIDARIRSFPRVAVQSKVVLDAKYPNLKIQRESSDILCRTNDGILSLRCGAGKTIVAIHTICRLQTPALILVNDLYLAEQWVEEILKFTDLKKEDVGFIGDGEFDWRKPFVVGLVQTVARRVAKNTLSRELVEWFGLVVADEAHTTAGPAYYNQAMTPFHGRRFGLSATPRREDAFDSLLKYTMGRVVYTYLMPELTPLIYFRKLPTIVDITQKGVKRATHTRGGDEHLMKLYGYMATLESRTALIVKEIKAAVAQGRHVLVLSQSRAMVERLARDFPNCEVHGDTQPRQERSRRIKERNPVIIMSRMGRQALDKPILDTLLVLDPNTRHGILQQLIGRIQRPHPDKQQPMVVFYEDHKVDTLHGMWMKVRRLLRQWPDDQGGALRWQTVE
jgi:superfamily II DNA or RNA helicase